MPCLFELHYLQSFCNKLFEYEAVIVIGFTLNKKHAILLYFDLSYMSPSSSPRDIFQVTFTCSKSTISALEKDVKFTQS